MEQLLESLEKFGLSLKESKVYLASLELGDCAASDIALKSNLPRTLVYDILERLIDLGIISYAIKENIKYFRAADPHELLRILHEKEEAVSKIIPRLDELYALKGTKRPRVSIYEGKEGMKTVMSDMLRSGVKEFFSYGSSRSSIEIIPAFMSEWHKERIKKKISARMIYNNTPESREKVKLLKGMKYTSFRFMPITTPSPTANLIYADKLVITSWGKDPFAVAIEDESMAENQKRYFEELWKIAKK